MPPRKIFNKTALYVAPATRSADAPLVEQEIKMIHLLGFRGEAREMSRRRQEKRSREEARVRSDWQRRHEASQRPAEKRATKPALAPAKETKQPIVAAVATTAKTEARDERKTESADGDADNGDEWVQVSYRRDVKALNPSAAPTTSHSSRHLTRRQYTTLALFSRGQPHLTIETNARHNRLMTAYRVADGTDKARRPLVLAGDSTLSYSDLACPDRKKCRLVNGRSAIDSKCRFAHTLEKYYHPRAFKTDLCVGKFSKASGGGGGGGDSAAATVGGAAAAAAAASTMCNEAATCGAAHTPNEIRHRRPQVYQWDMQTPDENFYMYEYMTRPCTCGEPTTCCSAGYHTDLDARRPPRKVAGSKRLYAFSYDSRPCDYVHRKSVWHSPALCPHRDDCTYAHTVNERRFHPSSYRYALCDRFARTGCAKKCGWGVACSLAHGQHLVRAIVPWKSLAPFQLSTTRPPAAPSPSASSSSSPSSSSSSSLSSSPASSPTASPLSSPRASTDEPGADSSESSDSGGDADENDGSESKSERPDVGAATAPPTSLANPLDEPATAKVTDAIEVASSLLVAAIFSNSPPPPSSSSASSAPSPPSVAPSDSKQEHAAEHDDGCEPCPALPEPVHAPIDSSLFSFSDDYRKLTRGAASPTASSSSSSSKSDASASFGAWASSAAGLAAQLLENGGDDEKSPDAVAVPRPVPPPTPTPTPSVSAMPSNVLLPYATRLCRCGQQYATVACLECERVACRSCSDALHSAPSLTTASIFGTHARVVCATDPSQRLLAPLAAERPWPRRFCRVCAREPATVVCLDCDAELRPGGCTHCRACSAQLHQRLVSFHATGRPKFHTRVEVAQRLAGHQMPVDLPLPLSSSLSSSSSSSFSPPLASSTSPHRFTPFSPRDTWSFSWRPSSPFVVA